MADPLVDELLQPGTWSVPVSEVGHLETHVSHLFFVGERVYKLKKRVDLGFLDFTTLEARLHFCTEELRLNRRLSPDVYLDVLEVVRDREGRLRIGERGRIEDFVVEMVRLPAGRMLDALLDRGEVDNGMMNLLAETLARFHGAAQTGPGVDEYGALPTVLGNVRENFDQTRAFLGPQGGPVRLSAVQHAFLEAGALEFLAAGRPLLARRVEEHRIRDGHGDLHAGNLCFAPQGLRIYDCLEFAERFRCSDVACDLAFLAMDLDLRGFRGFSDYLVHRYRELSGDDGLPLLMGFYKEYRAVVRAKVACFRCAGEQTQGPRDQARREALAYFALAASYRLPPALILTCGLPASGKSWAARAAARPGEAVVLSSDVRRKLMAGVPLSARVQPGPDRGLYSPGNREAVYRSLLEQAAEFLDSGRTVVVDATFDRAARRAPFLELARERGIPALVLHVTADEPTVRRRMAARANEAGQVSDADLSIYENAKQGFQPPDEREAGAQRVDARSGEESVEELASRVIDAQVLAAGF